MYDLKWFQANGQGKKIYLDEVSLSAENGSVSNTTWPQNGWPSVASSNVQSNGNSAVASVQSEKVRTKCFKLIFN